MANGFDSVILGTVQFGVPYGRRKGLPVLDQGISEEIMDIAWDMGIRKFDTAENYGIASNILSNWLKKRSYSVVCQVSTKIKVDQVNNKDIITSACSKFSNVCELTLMSHGALSSSMWKAFKLHCDSINVKAGQSVYSISEMLQAEKLGASSIQMPCNLLEWEKLKKINISKSRIDIRSVYLQGLLLEEPINAEKRVVGSGVVVQALKELANECNAPLSALLLGAMLHQITDQNNIVVGIDCISQLSDIKTASKLSNEIIENFISLLNDRNLLKKILDAEYLFDPRKWN